MTKTHQNAKPAYEQVGERHALALPIELEEGAPPVLARAALAVISGLIIALLIWANIASVRELSIAPGEIAPFGSSRTAAHLEGGIVDEVLVVPGDVVAAGEALVRLRVENSGGEYDRMEARRMNLTARAERLAAQAEMRALDLSAFASASPSMVAEQRAIYDAAVAQQRAVLETLTEREASAKSEVLKTVAELTAETELLSFAREQLAIQAELMEQGFTSKQAFLQANGAVATAHAKVASASARAEQAERSHTAASADLNGAKAEYQNRIAEERAAVIAELAELETPIASLKDRSDRLTVRSPIAGTVNAVLVNGQGDVVRPGGVVAEITPTGTELMAEVRVNPKDIGHINVGFKTDITVTTFDVNRYGKIDGHVAHISADTFSDERTGTSYYVAYIALAEQAVGSGKRLHALTPGMQVRADIITQKRTLMQYMLKPVMRSLDQAFTER